MIMLHERCENLPVGRTEAQSAILHATHLRPDHYNSIIRCGVIIIRQEMTPKKRFFRS